MSRCYLGFWSAPALQCFCILVFWTVLIVQQPAHPNQSEGHLNDFLSFLSDCLNNKMKEGKQNNYWALIIICLSNGEIKKECNSIYKYWICDWQVFVDLGNSSSISLTTQSSQKLFWSFQLCHMIIGMFGHLLFPRSRINAEGLKSQVLSQRGREALKVLQKFGNLNICNSMTTAQTPSAEEDHIKQSKAAEQLVNWSSFCFSCKIKNWNRLPIMLQHCDIK